MLIGPDESAHSCEIRENVFENNGAANGYGCGIYLEGRSRQNRLEGNLIIGGTSSGMAFFGSSHNVAANNVLVNIAPGSQEKEAAAFVIGHSYEGPPTQSMGNLIAHNTVWGCPSALAILNPSQPIKEGDENRLVNNVFGNCRFLSSTANPSTFFRRSNAWCKCPSGPRYGLTEIKESLKIFFKGKISEEREFVIEEPGFIAVESGNFRLKANSPMVDKAEPLHEVKNDGDGRVRPQGSFADVGAYEFDPENP